MSAAPSAFGSTFGTSTSAAPGFGSPIGSGAPYGPIGSSSFAPGAPFTSSTGGTASATQPQSKPIYFGNLVFFKDF